MIRLKYAGMRLLFPRRSSTHGKSSTNRFRYAAVVGVVAVLWQMAGALVSADAPGAATVTSDQGISQRIPRTEGASIPPNDEGPSAKPNRDRHGQEQEHCDSSKKSEEKEAGEKATGRRHLDSGTMVTSSVSDDATNSLQLASFQPSEIAPPQPPMPLPIPERQDTPQDQDRRTRQHEEILASFRAQPSVSEETTTGGDSTARAPTDMGTLISQAPAVQTTKTRQRAGVTNELNVRGFKEGQIYALSNGAFWMAARPDLDSMLGKIDPGMIDEVVIIPGPYGLRYGPGFAYINVVRAPTPRYDRPQSHFDLGGNTRTNGGQVYGRTTVYGGGPKSGYRISYGHRRGSDYEAGNGLKIPSSYHNRDVWGELGYDLSESTKFEFAYNRFDQTDTEYAAQFFNVHALVSNGFELRLESDDPARPWTQSKLGAWYNNTYYNGDTTNKNNPAFPVMQRVNWSLDQYFGRDPGPGPNDTLAYVSGITDGFVQTGGLRGSLLFGDPEGRHFRVGTDVSYVGQKIDETLWEPYDFGDTPIETDLPSSWLADTGIYTEYRLPVTHRWTAAVGARTDFVSGRARASDLKESTSLPYGRDDLEADDTLYSFYLNNEYEVNRHWKARFGLGYAQRPATLIERYSDAIFLTVAQSGLSRVVGDPQLDPERNWQIDVGVTAEYDRFRGKAAYYHSWLVDYITFRDEIVSGFPGARLLQYINTPSARLHGFELYGDYRLLPRLSVFGKMSYVEGTDDEIHQPLPCIPPLEGTVGLRLHDPQGGRKWGVELGTRIVTDQNSPAWIRRGDGLTDFEHRTGGFTTLNLRSYYNPSETFSLVAGIDNLNNRNYQEHLDGRLYGPAGFPTGPTLVLRPGITPYFSARWIY